MGPEVVAISMAASAAMSAVGAIQQGMAASAQAQASANAARYNAVIKEQQARSEFQQAGAREEQQRRQSRQVLGQQSAALAQAGIGLGGSALDIAEQSAFMAELDALNIRYEGDLRARGLLAAAEQNEYEARAAIAAGKNAETASYISAGASLLSGIGTYKYYSAGMPKSDVVSTFPVGGERPILARPLG